MASHKIEVDLEVRGKGTFTEVPNQTGQIVTLSSVDGKTLSTRTNAQILTDLGITSSLSLKADKVTQVIAGTGLIGGGDLSTNRTLSANFGTVAGTIMQGNDVRVANGQTAFGWGNHLGKYIDHQMVQPLPGTFWINGNGLMDNVGTYNSFSGPSGFHFQNGYFIQTNIGLAGQMFTLEITGNSNSDTDVPIDTIIQGYTFNNESIIKLSALNKGTAIGTVQLFRYNGFLCFHIPAASFRTYHFRLSGQTLWPKFTLTNAIKPTTGTDLNTTIVPANLINTTSFNPSLKADKVTQVIAGTGLIGGGDLSINRTLSANFGTTAGTIAQGNDSRIINGQTAFGWGNHASAGYSTQTLTQGTNITIIGNVISAATTNYLTNSLTELNTGTDIVGKLQTAKNLKDWIDAKAYLTASSITTKADKVTTITAGTGLSGGGDLSINRTISVNFGTTLNTVAQGNHTHTEYLLTTANAVSATKLVTPRAINGTNFDGTAAITTSLWGTARTITIGNTAKSVNGSANVTWTLAEIGITAGTLVGSGTYGYIPFFVDSSTLINGLLYQNTGTSFLGLGTITPETRFHLFGDKQTIFIQQNPSIAGNSQLALIAAGVSNYSSIKLEQKVIWSQTNATDRLYIGNTLGNAQITIDDVGRLGIGTASPTTKLHIYDNQSLSSTKGAYTNLTILQQSGPGSQIFVREQSVRRETGADWTTWSYKNGIDIDGVFQTPNSLRTFWEREPFINRQYFGSSGVRTLSISSGDARVGVNVDTPQAALDVHTNSNDYSTTIQVRQNNQGTQALASIQFSHAACPTTPAAIHLFNNGQLEINNSSIHPTYFRVNNRNVMLLDSAGRIGIDTYSPSAKLTVDGEVGQFIQSLQNKDEPSFSFKTYNGGSTVIDGSAPTFIQGLFYQGNYNTGINYYRGGAENGGFMTFTSNNGTEAMRLATNGYLSIGTTIATEMLTVNGNISTTSSNNQKIGFNTIDAYNSGRYPNYGFGKMTGENPVNMSGYFGITFGTAATERVRIDANGHIGVGTPTPTYPIHVNRHINQVSIYTSHDIVAFSDISVKCNIRKIDNVLERVVKSRGVIYDRIDCDSINNIGFIAQELEQQFPELVVENPDGTKAVKYQNATAVLFESVKELKNICDKQQSQIDELIKLCKNGNKS